MICVRGHDAMNIYKRENNRLKWHRSLHSLFYDCIIAKLKNIRFFHHQKTLPFASLPFAWNFQRWKRFQDMWWRWNHGNNRSWYPLMHRWKIILNATENGSMPSYSPVLPCSSDPDQNETQDNLQLVGFHDEPLSWEVLLNEWICLRKTAPYIVDRTSQLVIMRNDRKVNHFQPRGYIIEQLSAWLEWWMHRSIRKSMTDMLTDDNSRLSLHFFRVFVPVNCFSLFSLPLQL